MFVHFLVRCQVVFSVAAMNENAVDWSNSQVLEVLCVTDVIVMRWYAPYLRTKQAKKRKTQLRCLLVSGNAHVRSAPLAPVPTCHDVI